MVEELARFRGAMQSSSISALERIGRDFVAGPVLKVVFALCIVAASPGLAQKSGEPFRCTIENRSKLALKVLLYADGASKPLVDERIASGKKVVLKVDGPACDDQVERRFSLFETETSSHIAEGAFVMTSEGCRPKIRFTACEGREHGGFEVTCRGGRGDLGLIRLADAKERL